ncbi:alpha/beta fold hydrolase [Parathalassolituus penaei]|uniref:Alpha/beta hydrolase n=1 Tax=Parathalassolituus penaei TaxID=2997323 RepID=A0A9X3ISN9_9GAMM|nr:alpha/beta hydrolase [Parathalassolituus penaei]MCY0965450.1 alpha/beta hydrolase [Parathalassolituus penaei]
MQTLELPSRYGMLPALSWGQPSAQPVLAIHGWLDNSLSFEQLAPRLVEQFPHFRFIAVDLPGHGLAPHLPAGVSYPFWTWSEVLVDLLTFFGRPIHVMGHSMGAAAALLVAGSCPELMRSLVCIDALGPATGTQQSAVELFRRAMLEPTGRASPGFRELQEAIELRRRATPWLTAEQLQAMVARNLEHRAGRWHWRTDPRLRNHSRIRFTEDMLAGFLAGADLPVLVVRASKGILPEEIIQQRMACLPRGELVSLVGHHHCHMDPGSLPELVVAISHFLRECDCAE